MGNHAFVAACQMRTCVNCGSWCTILHLCAESFGGSCITQFRMPSSRLLQKGKSLRFSFDFFVKQGTQTGHTKNNNKLVDSSGERGARARARFVLKKGRTNSFLFLFSEGLLSEIRSRVSKSWWYCFLSFQDQLLSRSFFREGRFLQDERGLLTR